MVHTQNSGLRLPTGLQGGVQIGHWVCAQGGSWMAAQSGGNSSLLHLAGFGWRRGAGFLVLVLSGPPFLPPQVNSQPPVQFLYFLISALVKKQWKWRYGLQGGMRQISGCPKLERCFRAYHLPKDFHPTRVKSTESVTTSNPFKIKIQKPDTVAHTWDPTTLEAKTGGGFTSSKPAWTA